MRTMPQHRRICNNSTSKLVQTTGKFVGSELVGHDAPNASLPSPVHKCSPLLETAAGPAKTVNVVPQPPATLNWER